VKTAEAVIQGGICQLVTRVRAEADDDFGVRLTIQSDCKKVQAFADEVQAAGPVNVLTEITTGYDGVLLSTARKHLKGCCAACIAAPGVFKAMQVAGGMALPAEARIELRVVE
jgi:hypothetical protein